MIRVDKADSDRLDSAVLAAVAKIGGAPSREIERFDAVAEALRLMPRGKSHMRYLDNSVQRLRKAGKIRCGPGGLWRMASAYG